MCVRTFAALFAVAIAATTAHAQFIGEQQKQARCELSAIGSTRSPLAVEWIRAACNRLAVDADSLLNESGRQFHQCLVQNLSGAQSDAAANHIIAACRTAYPP
jgi:hypothetical protein